MVKKIIKFSASWCAPCRVYAPTFHEVSKMEQFNDIKFEEHDVEESDEVEEMVVKFKIQGVPSTVLLNENGEMIKKLSGNIPLGQLVDLINETIRNEEK